MCVSNAVDWRKMKMPSGGSFLGQWAQHLPLVLSSCSLSVYGLESSTGDVQGLAKHNHSFISHHFGC